MNNLHEEELDRVLHALNAAEPAAGFGDRLLAQLAAREEAPVAPKRAASRKVAWWSAGLAFAAACALLPAVFLRQEQPHFRMEQQHFASAHPAVESAHRLAEAATTLRSPDVSYARKKPLTSEPTVLLTSLVNAVPAQAANRGLADLPSMVAPPEAETRQEQRLVQIAHGRRPQEFALLNPEVQELVARQRQSEFDEFFPPQTPQEIYLATHISN